MRLASRAFASSSSGSWTPISANTFPERGVTAIADFFAIVGSPLWREPNARESGPARPSASQSPAWTSSETREARTQLPRTDRVHRAKRIAVEIDDDLENATAAESLEQLRERRFNPICASQSPPPTRSFTSCGKALPSSLLSPIQRTGSAVPDSRPAYSLYANTSIVLTGRRTPGSSPCEVMEPYVRHASGLLERQKHPSAQIVAIDQPPGTHVRLPAASSRTRSGITHTRSPSAGRNSAPHLVAENQEPRLHAGAGSARIV